MEITRFGPDDATEIAAYVDLANAVNRHDSPWEFPVTERITAARFRHGWDGEPSVPYLARVDGVVVGAGSVATSERDNLHLAWLGLGVHPEHRRRGHGTAILEHLLAEVRALGRTSLGVDGWDNEVTHAFAARHGFEPKSQAINRRQRFADVDWDELAKRRIDAEPAAAGYVLERWTFPTPDDRLEDLAQMASAINDAPTDDLDIEDEVFTAERMRAYEDAMAGFGHRMYRVVAREAATGELAGQTVIGVEGERPQFGHQHDTSVVRAHRGHRLGLLVKAEMLAWLREAEPELAEVDTWNAESNDHMIGVNEMLGYRVMGREVQFQRSL